MKYVNFFIAFLILNFSVKANNSDIFISNSTDSLIHLCLPHINADSIQHYMQELEDMDTRYAMAENRKEISEWIAAKFRSFGYTNVELQQFNTTFNNTVYDNYNVYCVHKGEIDSEILIGAHHDAVENSPGADDNTSGTAGVLEIARVLKQQNIELRHTIRFMTYANEESGLHGSKYDAFESVFLEKDISLMINMDMISNSSTDSASIYKLTHGLNSEFEGMLANDFTEKYAGMSANYSQTTGSSDHYWYNRNNYRILYFHEHEFSDVYHSINDLVIHTNKTYASRIVKSVFVNLMAFDKYTKDIELNVLDYGIGNAISLNWENNNNYFSEVYIYPSDSSFTKIAESTTDSLFINNLIPEKDYNCFIKITDDKGNYHFSDNQHFRLSEIPPPPSAFEAYGLTDSILFDWQHVNHKDIIGYNIYKGGDDAKKVNETLIKTLNYTIHETNYDNYKYYCITSVDNQGNESKPSSYEGVKPGTHNYLSDSIEILVLIDVRSNPQLSEQVNKYFKSILAEKEATIIQLDNHLDLSEEQLKRSKAVIYCMPDFRAEYSYINRYRTLLYNYIESGGKLLFSTANANVALSGFNRLFPNYIPHNNNSNTFLNTAKIDYHASSHFVGTNSAFGTYPNLEIDFSTLNLDYVDFVQSVEGNSETQTIYNYKAALGQNTNQMHNWPVGFEHIDNDYNLVFLSFPICFIKSAQSERLVRYILDYRFNGILTDYQPQANNQKLTVYPNPAKDEINILLNQPGNIKIYNVLGNIVVNANMQKGPNKLNTTEFESGFYLVVYSTETQTQNTKIIIN